MSLKGRYSPPFEIKVFDQPLTFRRMLVEDWEGLTDSIVRERLDAENARINEAMADRPPAERQEARTRAGLVLSEVLTMTEIIRQSTQTAKGIRRLLKHALIDQSLADWLDIVPPINQQQIAEEIAYMPVVKPADPHELPPQSEASGGGSDNDAKSPTGTTSAPTSSPRSESTPASFPSATSSPKPAKPVESELIDVA